MVAGRYVAAMVDYGDIQFHPDALDPGGLSRRLHEFDQSQAQCRLGELDDWVDCEVPPGRPPKEVPSSAAAQLQQALDNGHSYRAVETRYRPQFGVTRSWLQRNYTNGNLLRMAGGN